jgi:hypothetical protein
MFAVTENSQTWPTVRPLIKKAGLLKPQISAECADALKSVKSRPGSRKGLKTEIEARMCHDDEFAARCVVAIFGLQEYEEQRTGLTKFRNRVGFNKPDAQVFSPMVGGVLAGQPLSSKQLNVCRTLRKGKPRLGSYSGQLLKIIEGRLPDTLGIGLAGTSVSGGNQ